MRAVAEVVDRLREWLPTQPRPRGLAYICQALRYCDTEVTDALRYLKGRGEVKHQSTQGWVFLPLAVQQRIRRAA